jgi:predicted O-methyltransferase YrrM
VTKCFYDKTNYPEYRILKAYRKDLLQNNKSIKITDFGAGSKVFSSENRKISAIAQHVGIPKKRARFLFRLVNYLKCENILELGTSLGIGTAALAATKGTKVQSLEGCTQTAGIAQQQLTKFGFNNVDLQIGEFGELLSSIILTNNKPKTTNNNREPTTHNPQPRTDNRKPTTENRQPTTHNRQPQTTFDLIYFDGNHTREATLNYFRQLLSTAHNDTVFVFDDIHWSGGMEAAWEEIKAHPKVQISIDTFYLGLIFFRKEQSKQHFKIRL